MKPCDHESGPQHPPPVEDAGRLLLHSLQRELGSGTTGCWMWGPGLWSSVPVAQGTDAGSRSCSGHGRPWPSGAGSSVGKLRGFQPSSPFRAESHKPSAAPSEQVGYQGGKQTPGLLQETPEDFRADAAVQGPCGGPSPEPGAPSRRGAAARGEPGPGPFCACCAAGGGDHRVWGQAGGFPPQLGLTAGLQSQDG